MSERKLKPSTEFERESVEAVVVAAASRVHQALRCLEEYSKTIDVKVARLFEACRYKSYTILAAVERTFVRRNKIADCVVYGLVDGGDSVDAFVRRLRELAAAGVDVIQFRDKHRTDRELYEWAHAGAQVLRSLETLFIINDRADIAASVQADGVHVGQEELPVAAARACVGSALVGVSTHDIHQARQAVLDGADYIGCGPTFESQTKNFESLAGLDFLRGVTTEITLPSFAIGGISPNNLSDVAACGMKRVALSGAIECCEDLSKLVAEFKCQLGGDPTTSPPENQ